MSSKVEEITPGAMSWDPRLIEYWKNLEGVIRGLATVTGDSLASDILADEVRDTVLSAAKLPEATPKLKRLAAIIDYDRKNGGRL